MKKSISILALGVLSLGMVATVACGGGEQKAPAPAEAPKVVEEKSTTTTTVPATPATAAPATPETAAPATPSTTTTSTTTSTTSTTPEKK
jgi:hypothetical protein